MTPWNMSINLQCGCLVWYLLLSPIVSGYNWGSALLTHHRDEPMGRSPTNLHDEGKYCFTVLSTTCMQHRPSLVNIPKQAFLLMLTMMSKFTRLYHKCILFTAQLYFWTDESVTNSKSSIKLTFKKRFLMRVEELRGSKMLIQRPPETPSGTEVAYQIHKGKIMSANVCGQFWTCAKSRA